MSENDRETDALSGSWSDDVGTESHPVGGDEARDPTETGYDRETEETDGSEAAGTPPV